MRLSEIAARLGAELSGDGNVEITGVAGIEHAGPTEITFVANAKYASLAKKTRAAAVILEPDFAVIDVPSVRIQNPYRAFAQVISFFYAAPVYAPGVHPTAVIDPTAVLGDGAHVGAYVVVGPGVVIGEGAVLLPMS